MLGDSDPAMGESDGADSMGGDSGGGSDSAGPDSGGPDDGGPDGPGPDEPAGEDEPYSIEAFDYIDPRPEHFHALPQDDTTLIASDELAVLVGDQGEALGWTMDDRVDGGAPRTIDANAFGVGNWADATAGDVDGDGRDEIVVLRNEDVLGFDIVEVADDGATTAGGSVEVGGYAALARVITADLDGDYRDEVVVFGITGTWSNGTLTNPASFLSIYDDAQSGSQLLVSETAAGDEDFAVAAGDFDGDRSPELLVVSRDGSDTITARVRDDILGTPTDLAVRDITLDFGPDDADHDNQILGAVAADFDGDGIDEPVPGVLRREYGVGMLRVIAYEIDGASLWTASEVSHQLQDSTRSPYDSAWAWSLQVGDFNGDGRDELASNLLDHYEDQAACRIGHISLGNDDLPTPYAQNVSVFFQSSAASTQSSRCGLAVLDDDRDSRDAFVTAMVDPGPGGSQRSVELARHVAAMDGKTVTRTNTSNQPFIASSSSSSPLAPRLVGGDFDGDSLRVVSTGNKWLSLPHPRVMVVAAAPPTEKGLSHNFTLTGTTYATDSSQGTGEGETHTIHASAALSFEVPLVPELVTAGVSAELTEAFNETKITTEQVTYGNAFVGGSDHDRVIFHGTLYMSYEYEIVASPHPELIGTKMTIDEPVDHKTYSWTLDYFNSQVAPEHRIGSDILSHTVGDVSSYKRAQDKDQLLLDAQGLQSTEAPVDQGDGVRERFIEISSSTEQEFTRTLDTTYEGGLSIPGVGFSGSYGYEDGNIYTITVGESVRYESAVGDLLDPQEYTDYGYSYGMFVRNEQGQNGSTFQVIDYWVSQLGPGH